MGSPHSTVHACLVAKALLWTRVPSSSCLHLAANRTLTLMRLCTYLPSLLSCSAVTLMTEQVEKLMFELSMWRASPELKVGTVWLAAAAAPTAVLPAC